MNYILTFFKVTIRNFYKNKLFTCLNLIGMSMGMTVFILIMLWVKFEMSYDRFHEKGSDIYRLVTRSEINGKSFNSAVTPAICGGYLVERIPEIVGYTTFRPFSNSILVSILDDSTSLDKSFYEKDRIYVDSNFFNIFSFPFKYGKPELLHNSPFTVAISESLATKYFGSGDPVGRYLRFSNRKNFVIVGVFKDVPKNSHINFNIVFPWEYLESLGYDMGWDHFYFNNYLLLDKEAHIPDVNKKITNTVIKATQVDNSTNYHLQSLSKVHLKSDMDIDIADSESEVNQDVYYFQVIALFILLIAMINYVNLTTAMASVRVRAIGLRKIIGATNFQLMLQVIGETLIIILFSLFISSLLIELLLPIFDLYSGIDLRNLLYTPFHFLMYLFLIIFSIVFAGLYPGYYLTSFKAVSVIKDNISEKTGKGGIRKFLFVLQVSISSSLIIMTLIVHDQIIMVQSKGLGYNKENLLIIPVRGDILVDYQELRAKLMEDPSIVNISVSSDIPTTTIHLWGGNAWEGQEEKGSEQFNFYTTDYNFLQTMGLTLKEGRWFEQSTDSVNYVINEAAAKFMGMEKPIGKWFENSNRRGRIIGVVKDFNFKSLREKVAPLIFRAGSNYQYIIMRFQPEMEKQAIKKITEMWDERNTVFPIKYDLLTDQLAQMYVDEHKKETVYKIFTLLAILLSCLGIFGLTAFTLEKRKKEVAIRKVMGAGIHEIVLSLSSSFVKLTIIANIITWPFTWYLMSIWLNTFSFRVNINYFYFVYAFVISMLILSLTIAYHVIIALRTNPADSLKPL